MKNVKLFVAILLVLVLLLAFVACETNDVVKGNGKIEIALASGVSPILKVGDTDVDFTKFFTVKDANGNAVTVTSDMIDLSKFDTSKPGSFEIIVTYEGESFTTIIAVIPNTDVPVGEIEIALAKDLSLSLNVGDEDVDFTKYFTVKDAEGNAVTVTIEMLDLSNVDTTKEGTFDVTLSYGGKELTATFTVNGKIVPPELSFEDILAKYADVSNWNHVINLTMSGEGLYTSEEEFSYLGNIIKYAHEDLVDYIVCNDDGTYLHYGDLGSALYTKTVVNEDNYDDFYFPELWLDCLVNCDFNKVGDHHEAVNPQVCGNELFGEEEGCTYTKVEIYTDNGEISKLVVLFDFYYEDYDETYNVQYEIELSEYGTVDFDISNLEIAYGDGVENDEELSAILAKYVDAEAWNFSFDIDLKYDGAPYATLGYGYVGDNAINVYYDKQQGLQLIDYLIYDEENDFYYYLLDNGDGTHSQYTDDDIYFYWYASYMYVLNVDYLYNCAFKLVGDHYEAIYPQVTGDMVYGPADGCVYTSVELYVENGLISKLVFFSDEVDVDEDTGEEYPYTAEATFEFANFGTLEIDISDVVIKNEESGDDPVIPDEPVENPEELENAINDFADRDNWSFAVKLEQIGDKPYNDYYEYYKNLMLNKYDIEGTTYIDYYVFDPIYGDFTSVWADYEGYYEEITADSDYDTFYYDYYYYIFPVDPTILAYFEFELMGDYYAAKDPVSAASYMIGSSTDSEWVAFIVKLSDGKLSSYEGVFDDGTILRFTFSNYGEIELQLPEEGGDEPDPSGNTLTSTFVSTDLSVGKGQIEYTSSIGAYGFDANGRGVQFTQGNGVVVLTSKTSINGIKSVSVVVSTNAELGMQVSIKVGGVALTCDEATIVTVNNSKDLKTLTFISESALNGNVEITLTPTQTKKSMYILSITISRDSEGGDEPVIPDEPVENPEELENAINDFADRDNWSFVVNVEQVIDGETYTDYYEYYKNLMLNRYEAEDGNTYNDYWVYDPAYGDFMTLWADCGDEYVELTDGDEDFYYAYIYICPIDPSLFANFEFELVNNYYSAKDPVNAAGYAIGEFEDGTWTSLVITLANGKIATVEATLDDGTIFRFTFSSYGEVELQLPEDGGDEPVIPDDPTDEILTSTFVNSNLGVGNGEIEYTSNISAVAFIENRGLQFTQGNGIAVLTSKTSLSGVRSVTVVVQTNAELGVQVSIKVGGVALTSGGETIVTVPSTNYTELVTLTFVSEDALNGNVEVTLTPTQTKKSMYILSITVSKSAEGDIENPNPPTPPTPSGNVMENQTYNPSTFDDERLQDKLLAYEDEGAIGLPSEGEYNVLVVPVQFKGDTITAKQLANLELAFNGTGADTGWESVKTYYQQSSYGKLNLTFDIQDVYHAKNNSSYYEKYQKTINSQQGSYDEYGDAVILREVLAYYESILDLTKYDTNNDGCIDAVYLIYSAPIDYSDDSFYWAYVTWYYGEESYDDLYAYYYLFASIDFMDEDLKETGLTINTTTYIHETGHLLGLDDYYDYYEKKGSNMGLGGADMMDYTVGDHNPYSKIMLNWVDAQIVTTTTTITIGNLVSTGDCILVPLAFDNSYFSEYLLIDLYSATGLNELAANAKDSLLYDGAKYGVRIYHVSSSDNNPYSDEEYGSYTDNNNSTSKYALIKLVEADGEYNYNKSNGYTTEDDLWQAGDSLSGAFKTYTRNDGKVVNFDITINSVSSTEASITITFAE